MPNKPSHQFYPGDFWREKGCRAMTSAAFGAYVRMFLTLLDDGGEWTGPEDAVRRLAGAELSEWSRVIGEWKMYAVLDIVTHSNGDITVTQRRLYREAQERKAAAVRAKRHRTKAQMYAEVTPPSRENHNTSSSSSSSTSSSTSFKKNIYTEPFVEFSNLEPKVEYVQIHQAQYENLCAKWPKAAVDEMVLELDEWLCNNPNKRKGRDCNRTLHNWLRRESKKKEEKKDGRYNRTGPAGRDVPAPKGKYDGVGIKT